MSRLLSSTILALLAVGTALLGPGGGRDPGPIKPPPPATPQVVRTAPVQTHPYEDGFEAGFELGKAEARPKAKPASRDDLDRRALEISGTHPDRNLKWQRGWVDGYLDGFRSVSVGLR